MAAVRTTPQADASILTTAKWWREHRDKAPDLFEQELRGTVELLRGAPELGQPYRRVGVPGARRLLLPRTRYHIYYVYDRAADMVVVLALWSAVRGRGPRLAIPPGTAIR